MNKSYSPAVIPSFADGESMEEVRVKTINPLVSEASRLGQKVNDLSNTSSTHSIKIAALEAGGGGGGGSGVDLTPIITRLSAVENEASNLDVRVDTVENDQVIMKGQITALENSGGGGGGSGSSTFTGLSDTPSSLVPNMILKVNPAGTAIILDAHDHQKVDGRQIMYTWNADDLPGSSPKTVSQENVAKRSFFISATSNTGKTVTFDLPGIASENAVPTNTQVPGGRMMMFTNTGASDFVLIATTAGHKISSGTDNKQDSITIGAGKFAQIMAVCNNNGTYKNYHVVSAGDTTAFA